MTDRGRPDLMTRRGFLGTAAAAVAAVSLPFDLKPEDLEPAPLASTDPGERFKLAPDELLIVLAELEDPKAGAKEIAAYGFLEDEDPGDDVPLIRYRIEPPARSVSFVVGKVWGVTIKADPGVRVRIRTHVAGQWIEAESPG